MYSLYVILLSNVCFMWLCIWLCSVIYLCNVCLIWLCSYVFGSMYVLYGFVVMYLDPYSSFKGVLYVVCTIEERGKKVIEMCSVNIDVIYVCQL